MFVSKTTQEYKKSTSKPYKGVVLTRKKATRKKKPAEKKTLKKKAPPEVPPKKEAPKKIAVTVELRRIWYRVRKAWDISLDAFGNTLTLLSDKEAEQLYELVRHSLFKGSYVEIIREHPELREIVRSDDDRICMHDIYEALSWRLGKSEALPKDVAVTMKMKGRIGRDATGPSYW